LSIRAFLSFDVEDEEVLDRIVDAQRRLALSGARLKLVGRENVHICIRFLGQIAPRMVEDIGGIMDGLGFSEFGIGLKGLGAFPSPSYPRVVWVGVKEGAEELTRIHDEMERGLAKLGIRPETRAFRPHCTLARVKGGRRGKLSDVIRSLSDHEFGTIKAERLRLKRSVLTPRGPVYTTLYEAVAAKP